MWRLFVLLQMVIRLDGAYYPPKNADGWPICSPPQYTENGNIDVYNVLYTCSVNIPGAQLPPSYYPNGSHIREGAYSPTINSVSLKINDLVSIDDVTTVVSLDFNLRASWNDTRWYVPFLFDSLNPGVKLEGIDITNYVRNANNPLPFYLTDLVFFQSITLTVLSEKVKLFENGLVYWSRHMYVSFAEPQMNFRHYPLDVQNFSMVMQSYAHDTKFIELVPFDPPISLRYDNQQLKQYVDENQLWNYLASTAHVEADSSPSPQNPTRAFSNAYFNMKFARDSLGIVYRLALPVTILLLIVGFSFWSDLEERQGVTINMLLVVAALYIVIGQVIPFVGYLSTMDKFTTSTFILLSVTVGINITVNFLIKKQSLYPLYIFHKDLTMYLLKVVWIPSVIYMFIVTFDIQVVLFLAFLYISIGFSIINALVKFPKLQKSLRTSVLLLRAKEKKMRALSDSLVSLEGETEGNEHDDDDDDEKNELLGEFEDNFKIAGEDKPPPTKKQLLKKEVKQFELTSRERLVLWLTADWYNNAASLAEVFGVAGLQDMAKDMIGMKKSKRKRKPKGELNDFQAYVDQVNREIEEREQKMLRAEKEKEEEAAAAAAAAARTTVFNPLLNSSATDTQQQRPIQAQDAHLFTEEINEAPIPPICAENPTCIANADANDINVTSAVRDIPTSIVVGTTPSTEEIVGQNTIEDAQVEDGAATITIVSSSSSSSSIDEPCLNEIGGKADAIENSPADNV